MDAIKAEHLTKKYKDLTVVDGLDLAVREGELFRRYEEEHYQRAYPLDTIKILTERAGFELLHIYDGFTRRAAKEDSERICVVCRRKPQKGERT